MEFRREVQLKLIFTILIFPIEWSSCSDYCKIRCDVDTIHTMCHYRRKSKYCVDYEVTYQPKLGELALKWHNMKRDAFARGQIQMAKGITDRLPNATNMRLMTWDPELAAIMYRWLSRCKFQHDNCRDTSNYKVGQNIGTVEWYPGFDTDSDNEQLFPMFRPVFEGWWDEMMNMDISLVDSYNPENNSISHFTQVIWAHTYKIGCSEVFHVRNGIALRVIGCNYAPRGNTIGKSVYRMGSLDSPCPYGTVRGIHDLYPGLCGTRKDAEAVQDFELMGADVASGLPLNYLYPLQHL